MNLLAVAHNYRHQNKKVLLLKPILDSRFGVDVIKSRSGLTMDADILVDEKTFLTESDLSGVSCLLVDEAQFLSTAFIDQLRDIAIRKDIPVICYGLRTDFKTHLFKGSQRLLELADSIEEVKTTCAFCNRKAVFNLKFVAGKPTRSGDQIDLGGDEKYLPSCAPCYQTQTRGELGNLSTDTLL